MQGSKPCFLSFLLLVETRCSFCVLHVSVIFSWQLWYEAYLCLVFSNDTFFSFLTSMLEIASNVFQSWPHHLHTSCHKPCTLTVTAEICFNSFVESQTKAVNSTDIMICMTRDRTTETWITYSSYIIWHTSKYKVNNHDHSHILK